MDREIVLSKAKVKLKDFEALGLKILDKMDALPEVALKAGVAYTGVKATNHWTGGLLGLVGLKLATGNNIFAGASGVALLTWLGLTGWVDPYEPGPPVDQAFVPGMSGVGAGGGGYIPTPGLEGVLMNTQDCLKQGGSILQIIPMTPLCRCALPAPAEEHPLRIQR